jgi:aminoglycoside phosphotransferase (APT) family kinase protein
MAIEGLAPGGIHVENVSRFLREHLPACKPPFAFELISGGRSNLTYLVRDAAGSALVLRRPPLGHVLPTAHDMAREFRVLRGLAGTPVPAPRPLALCEDAAVNEVPFYVMTWCPGVVPADDLPPGFATRPEERARMSEAFVDTLVVLHAVDYAAVGLADLGRPEGYLERQVRRWSQQWERSRTAPLPAIEELLRRLAAALPPSPAAAIVHGDYRIGNMAFDPADTGRVVAVFDWEMATLGDPLADLGYALIYWKEIGDPAWSRLPRGTDHPGFWTRAQLASEYAKRSGRDVAHVEFYQVLALTKLAVISEGIYARHHQGKTLGRGFEDVRRESEPLAAHALELADAAADPRLRGR